MNREWSFFISPINQSMLGIVGRITEAAHPFRVEKDSIACAFIEYNDPLDTQGIKIRKVCSDLQEKILECVNGCDYIEAVSKLKKKQEYLSAKNRLMDDFFWTPGKYSLDVSLEYDKGKEITFPFEFYVSEQNYNDLLMNIDESLITQMKLHYNMKYAFRAPLVEIKERQKS